MSVCFKPPYNPLLHSKTGVCRGLHYLLIFALKHIYRVLVRTATIEAVLTCTHNICFEQKYEISKNKSTKKCHFYSREKSQFIIYKVVKYRKILLIYIVYFIFSLVKI